MHDEPAPPGRFPWPRSSAVALTAVAGCVDAVGYLVLAHVFVANMSGNSIAVGLHAGDLRWHEAWRRGFPIVMFVAGLFAGGVIAEVQRRRWQRHPTVRANAMAVTLTLEWVLLAAFLAVSVATFGWSARRRPVPPQTASADWPAPPPVGAGTAVVALAAVAMGVQNVSLRASGALSVYTTHVTGSLTRLADDAVTYGLWVWDRLRRRRPPMRGRLARLIAASPRHPSLREMLFLTATWTAYVLGAAGGAIGLVYWGIAVVFAPLAVLAIVTGVQYVADAGRSPPHKRKHQE